MVNIRKGKAYPYVVKASYVFSVRFSDYTLTLVPILYALVGGRYNHF